MGLFHKLVGWGIQAMDNTETDLHRLGQRLGYMPLSWHRVAMTNPSKQGLLWRVPDPDVQMANSLSRIQAIIVSEYERAMVLKDGQIIEQEVLPPGLYDISRTVQIRGQIEVIWTTTKEVQLRWGVADILTKDRITIGASGYYRTTIGDPRMFLLNVAGQEQVYKDSHLFAFAKPEVSSTLRDLMARKTVMEFQLAREEFIEDAKKSLQPIFERWGLDFLGLTIENQNIPQEFRDAAAAQTIVHMEMEGKIEGARSEVILAQLEAQKGYYLAEAELGKYTVLQHMGMDPLTLERAQALKILAAHPGHSLVDNRAGIMERIPEVLPGAQPVSMPPMIPADPGAAATKGFPGTADSSHASPNMPNNSGIGLTSAASSTSSMSSSLPNRPLSSDTSTLGSSQATETMTREKIEQMLDKLDERFANGEISEQTYLTMSGKWQKKLAQLP